VIRPPYPHLLDVAGGTTLIGSTAAEIATSVSFWGERLGLAAPERRQLRDTMLREHPPHQVVVEPFRLGRTPVTQREYAAFVADTGFPVPPSTLDAPAVPVWGIDVHAALVYCSWLSDQLRRRVRLPSETEWEWAARGPDRLRFPWGDRFDPTLANTREQGPGHPTPCGTYPGGRSWCGVDDLAGNVEEWVAAPMVRYAGGREADDHLARRHPDELVVLRGGSCTLGGDLARSARRHGGPLAGDRYKYTGFRVATDMG
jgi:formylglycine-generating enzyme required for sulfatase activity